MNLKKFLAPNIAILLFLSVFWFAGIDPVVKPGPADPQNEHQKNLEKYVKVQREILDNYVDKIDITRLYERSIKGLISNLKDSTANFKSTPLDTTFTNLKIKGLRGSIEHFDAVYKYVQQQYPKENMTNLTADAIRGMFDMLDPHSIYIDPEKSKSIEQDFKGKFQGVGIQFTISQDTIMVISVISGGPSDKLGIQSGDRIIGIGDSSAVGISSKDVQHELRGKKGTKVNVKIKRPHVEQPMNFTITRDDIPLYTVDSSYMLNKKTGYIKINRFAATTHKEFMQAVRKLQKNGMNQLMIDLRGNPGGYLSQAIGIAEEFYPKGTKILSTKSRHPRFTNSYYSRRTGKLRSMPLIILVNSGSASASEIVSGAIQDHDRGLIVGQRTFGKGLVQQQYGLVDSSNIRVTISRYYTPSGRLIQKPYSGKGSESYAYEIYKRSNNARTDVHQYLEHVPDSLQHHTDAGRIVYGGGGIVPDHIVQEDTTETNVVLGFMRRNLVDFNFTSNYLDKEGQQFRKKWENNFEGFRKKFQLQPKDYDKILSMMKDENLAISDTLSDPKVKSDTLFIPKGYYQKVHRKVGGIVKSDIAEHVWGAKKKFEIFNDVFSNAIDKAMKLWPQARAFANDKVDAKNQESLGLRDK